MSQYSIKHSIIFPMILASLAMVVTLVGCTDEVIGTTEIPDVEVEMKGEVVFRPFVTTEIQTRARAKAPEGTEYKGIKSLYVCFFNSERQFLDEYSGYVNFTPTPSEGSTHEHVTFTKKIQAGRYYVYAVANISDEQKRDLESVRTIEDLRAFKVNWNDDIAKDIEMFGVFKQDGEETIPDNEGFEADELLTITPAANGIHSWVRRTVSKVTIDFDGTNLKEGVTVYIKNATLKDVPDSAFIGQPSAVGMDSIKYGTYEYSISYGEGESYRDWPTVTKTKTFSPTDVWGNQSVASFHDDNARALPCYENMQGEPEGRSKLQDSDADGKIDSYRKDSVNNGTYLEVEGYYVADRPEYKSRGKIIYRFMLGKDAVKNFDLVRNHHYKITMRFKGYGNDIDWHIDYAEKYLDVTYPEDVNYQGKFFLPDLDYLNVPNAGHSFDDKNVITVNSYKTDITGNSWIEPEISYTYYSHNNQTGKWEVDNTTSGWLTSIPGAVSSDSTQKQYTFVASRTDSSVVKMSDLFPAKGNGSKEVPYNLSGTNGGSTIVNTANCYMVGAPGWYCLPLVYGNAITGEDTITAAYSSTHIVNHLNKNITSPYIKDNVDLSDVSVKLIWQDAENLVIPKEIKYDPTLFDGKGGIKFHIGDIQEGNAVIALIDNSAGEDTYVSSSTKAVWSWHIWVTRFGFEDFEKNIRILNHEEKAFDVMPVNLGWCSGGKDIIYYKRRKCEIKFKVGEHEIIRTIEQYPHLVLPRGDHPYYQWGRKDPFVGTNLAGGNKARWDHDGNKYDIWEQFNPPRMYNEPGDNYSNDKRKHTIECLAALIKNPDKWHNSPREPKDINDLSKGFNSINKSYSDLWSNNGCKTIYDPCPSGYQVGSDSVFTGFTTSGRDEVVGLNWNDVLEENMVWPKNYYTGSVNSHVLELYTDTRKIQSITFPVSGYRDYDKKAGVINYPNGDYKGEGYVWSNVAESQTNSYHMKFIRSDLNGGDWKKRGILIAFFEKFFNTDGFGVRPVGCTTK